MHHPSIPLLVSYLYTQIIYSPSFQDALQSAPSHHDIVGSLHHFFEIIQPYTSNPNGSLSGPHDSVGNIRQRQTPPSGEPSVDDVLTSVLAPSPHIVNPVYLDMGPFHSETLVSPTSVAATISPQSEISVQSDPRLIPPQSDYLPTDHIDSIYYQSQATSPNAPDRSRFDVYRRTSSPARQEVHYLASPTDYSTTSAQVNYFSDHDAAWMPRTTANTSSLPYIPAAAMQLSSGSMTGSALSTEHWLTKPTLSRCQTNNDGFDWQENYSSPTSPTSFVTKSHVAETKHVGGKSGPHIHTTRRLPPTNRYNNQPETRTLPNPTACPDRPVASPSYQASYQAS